MTTSQLPLALRWPPRQRFEHFHAGANAAAVAGVRAAAENAQAPWTFIAGAHASGKSHLLMAACQHALACGRRVQYLPLADPAQPRAEVIRGGAGSDLVAIDDAQELAGDAQAEHALFDLYNRAHAEQATLLFAARETPLRLALTLPDLRSRLGACALFALKPLSDAERRAALRAHAAARGMPLDDQVLDWLFARYTRDLHALHALLEGLDSASLATRRRITVPFLRDYLRDSGRGK